MKLVKKHLLMSLSRMLLVGMIIVAMVPMINVASASPDTYIYVDPLEVKDVQSGGTFFVTINVTEAPPSYGWEIYLSWDPDLLQLVEFWDPYWSKTVGVMEGDFLDRRYEFMPGFWVKNYTTTFVHDSLIDANIEGEIRITCSLKGNVPWASGEGWLATLKFSVEAEGACVLNLFDTRLWDYELAGSPSYTYHANLDGFFYNRGFPPNSSFHDIAITSVTASPTVVENESVTIDVTVRNEGNYSETSATFNVTVYADITAYEYTYDILGRLIKTTVAVGDEITVGTKTLTDPLAPGANTTLTFAWNTTGVVKGNYTISAEVKGDDDTRNNLFIDDTVRVIIMGDVNGDGTVDGSDLTRVAEAFGSESGDLNWDEGCDLNGDGKVEALDLFRVGENYGRSV